MVSKKKAAQKSKGKSQAEEGVPEAPPPKKGSKGAAGKGKKQAKSWSHGPSLDEELALLGLRIKNITADGNCFFRALGDQLKGDEGMHTNLRQQIVNHMVEHEDDFAPFVEDDEKFAPYISRMRKDGTWAGCMEVVAASRALPAHLTIYQEGQPRWAVPSPVDEAPMLHLSYHDGMHYNSVRNADDFGRGPPQPVVLKPVAGNASDTLPVAAADSSSLWGPREEARVLSSTACERPSLARAALAAVGGNVESAIEYVIEQLAKEEEVGGAGNEEEGDSKVASAGEQGEEESQCSNLTAAPVPGTHVSSKRGTGGQQSRQEAEQGQVAAAAAAAAIPSISQCCQHQCTDDCNGSCKSNSCVSMCNGGVLMPHEVVTISTASTVTDKKGTSTINGGMAELHGGSSTDEYQHLNDGQWSQQQQQQQQPSHELPQTQSQEGGQESPNPAQPCCDGRTCTSVGGEQQEPQHQQHPQADGQLASKKGVRVGKKDQRPDKQPNRNKPCPCGSKIKYKNCCLVRKKKAADMPQPVAEVGSAPAARQLATIFL